METGRTGAWTPYSTSISKEAMDVFNKTKPIGVNYVPLAVATQVVSGTNYRFFCNAQVMYPDAPNDAVITQIYQPLSGEAHITSITKI